MNAGDGGPAFPSGAPYQRSDGMVWRDEGMSLRDYFATHLRSEKVEDVGACDDNDLLDRFGTEAEKEEGFRMVFPGPPSPVVAGREERETKMPFRNIELRATLEARARAALRFVEADAMLSEREKGLAS